jgi:large subunit ribosomal protein L25
MASSTEQLVVSVDPRDQRGKNAARRLRAHGKVPGNVYGMSLDPFAVAVDARRVEEILRLGSGRNTIFTLSLGDTKQSRAVMLRELQRDPVSERLVHVDFLRVDPTKTVNVQIPVRLVGIPEGVKTEGGVLDFVHRQVEVSCLPSSIPEHLDVDISHLHINQNISVKELGV